MALENLNVAIQNPKELSSSVKRMRNIAGILFGMYLLYWNVFQITISSWYRSMLFGEWCHFLFQIIHLVAFGSLIPLCAWLMLFLSTSNKNIRIAIAFFLFIYALPFVRDSYNVIAEWLNLKIEHLDYPDYFCIITKDLIEIFGFGIIVKESKRLIEKSWIFLIAIYYPLSSFYSLIFIGLNIYFREMLSNNYYIFRSVLYLGNKIYDYLSVFVSIFLIISFWKLSHCNLFLGQNLNINNEINLIPDKRYFLSLTIVFILLLITYYLGKTYLSY